MLKQIGSGGTIKETDIQEVILDEKEIKMIKFVKEFSPEKEVKRLIPTLENFSDDEVYLCVREEDDTKWYIGKLTARGKLNLCEGIPDKLGFSLDKDGKIEVENE